jgi:hypothetical protein
MFPKEHGDKGKPMRPSSFQTRERSEHCPPKSFHCFTGSQTSLVGHRFTFGLVAFLFSSLTLLPQNSPYNANQHKALYLFNFAKYTEWPTTAFANENDPLSCQYWDKTRLARTSILSGQNH